MTTQPPAQLALLAENIKLSLLERQRAQSLGLVEPEAQESHVARSLESLREGVEALENRSSDPALFEQITSLRHTHAALYAQFHGFPPPEPSRQPASPESSSSPPPAPSSTTKPQSSSTRGAKAVRFSPAAVADDEDEANRSSLFPAAYHDDPADQTPDHEGLSNPQIHAYHSSVMAEQDEQLDRLGVSISRQRELSMQIGDELEGQVRLLDEVDDATDRVGGRLGGARKRLGNIARKAARGDRGMWAIFVLVVILVVLIIVLK